MNWVFYPGRPSVQLPQADHYMCGGGFPPHRSTVLAARVLEQGFCGNALTAVSDSNAGRRCSGIARTSALTFGITVS